MALDTAQERHVKIEDRDGKKTLSKLYYHRECWSEIMRDKATMQNLNKEAMGFMRDVKKMIGAKDEVEVS